MTSGEVLGLPSPGSGMVGTLVPGSLLTADIAIVVLDINTPTDRIWFRLAYCDVLILFLQGIHLVHDLSIYIF